MSGTHVVQMGERGRIVLPKDVRDRLALIQGLPLVLVETEDGLVLATREQMKRFVRRQLAGASLVEELLADRRRAAADEDR